MSIKKNSFTSKTVVILGVLLLCVAAAFQNCAKFVAQSTEGAGSISDPTIPQLETPSPQGGNSRIRMGDRAYLANMVSEIFGPDLSSPGDFQLIATISNPLIMGNYSAFGGPCDIFEDGCDHTRSQVAVVSSSSASRAGFMHQVCEKILERDYVLNQFFVINFGKTTDAPLPALTPDTIRKAYNSFLPDRAMDGETTNALVALSLELRDLQYTARDQWRFLLFAVCISPNWQVP